MTVLPDAIEDEEELNEYAAKRENASHEGGGHRMRHPSLVRDLSRNLVSPHRLFYSLSTTSQLEWREGKGW